jgi:hypothetical protein
MRRPWAWLEGVGLAATNAAAATSARARVVWLAMLLDRVSEYHEDFL